MVNKKLTSFYKSKLFYNAKDITKLFIYSFLVNYYAKRIEVKIIPAFKD